MFFSTNEVRTGKVQTFFFSYDEYKDQVQLSPEEDLIYLSLGETFNQWHEKTSDFTKVIYETALRKACHIISNIAGIDSCERNTSCILFGNICLYFAMRFSRALAQVRLIEKGTVEFREINNHKIFQENKPWSTVESLNLLNSENFGNLIEELALKHHLDLKYPLGIDLTHLAVRVTNPSGILSTIYICLQRFLSIATRKNKYLLISTYLSRFQETLIGLSLFQVPHLTEIRARNFPMKTTHIESLSLSGDASLEEMIEFLVRILLPVSLTTGFRQTLETANRLGFPASPQAILTATSFEIDDEFKAFLAARCTGVPYAIIQHGVGFGVSKLRNIVPELEVSNYFLTWGWQGASDREIPFGIVKQLPLSQRNFAGNKIEIFLRPDKFNFYSFADVGRLNDIYFPSIIKICQNLNEKGLQISLRPHLATKQKTLAYLTENIADLEFCKISTSRKSLKELAKQGVSIVFTYDSTGMIELGVSKNDFFAFLPDGLDHVRSQYLPNYEALKRCGLLEENAEIASEKIEVWLQRRGKSKTYSAGIQEFTTGLAHKPLSKVRSLRSFLLDLSSKSIREN